jgi:hypothetical protein
VKNGDSDFSIDRPSARMGRAPIVPKSQASGLSKWTCSARILAPKPPPQIVYPTATWLKISWRVSPLSR